MSSCPSWIIRLLVLVQVILINCDEDRYKLLPPRYNYDRAKSSCETQDGLLPVVNTDKQMLELSNVMEKVGLDHVWVNAKESLYPWKWVHDEYGRTERDQGCFIETSLRDFTYKIEMNEMKRDSCVNQCKTTGYTYAALQTIVQRRTNHGECRCGNTLSYSDVQNVHLCDDQCPGEIHLTKEGLPASPGFCGAEQTDNSYYRVFHTDDQGSLFWGSAPVEDYDMCGSLVAADQPGDTYYYLKKQKCTVNLNFICQSTIVSSQCDYLDGNICYSVSLGDDIYNKKNWFEARSNCMTKGGDLAYVDESTAKKLKQENLLKDGVEYFVGLTGSHWKWNDDDEIPFKETSWKDGQPNSISEKCILMDINRTWEDVGCLDTNRYICKLNIEEEISSTPAPTTPTPPLPSSSTASSSTVSSTKAAEDRPAITDDPNLSSHVKPPIATTTIIGIVVGILLGIAGIIGVVVLGLFVLKRSATTTDEGLTKRGDEYDGYTNPAFTPSRATSMQDIGPDGVQISMSSNYV